MSKASNTGLLPDEQLVMDLLVGAWNGFVALPVQHVSDKRFRKPYIVYSTYSACV